MYEKMQKAFDILSAHKEALIGASVGIILGAGSVGICWYISGRKVDSTESNDYNNCKSSQDKAEDDPPETDFHSDKTAHDPFPEVELSSVKNGYDQLVRNLNILREQAEAEAAEYQKHPEKNVPWDETMHEEDDIIPDYPQDDPPETDFHFDEEAHNQTSKDIYVITEEEFDQLQMSSDIYWDREELEWYTVDDIVCNACTDEVYEEPCEYIGNLYLDDSNWTYDEESEGDTMHVRNDGLETDYIVYKVDGAYYYENQS